VFELSPNGSEGWKQTVLHTFANGKDGTYSSLTSLIFDLQGNLYGITSEGGATEFGVLFKLHRVGKRWVETVLYSFASGAGVSIRSTVRSWIRRAISTAEGLDGESDL
jgi:hypothetical protein